jgi:hypothetical protein
MDTFHVITEVPMPGKAITWDSAFTAVKSAKEGFLAVAVHAVDIALVA